MLVLLQVGFCIELNRYIRSFRYFGDIERLYAAVLLTSVTGIVYKVYITDGTEVSEFIPGYLYYLGIEEQVLINDLHFFL